MDRMQYRELLPLVNDKDQMDRLLAYVGYRITTLRDQLEHSNDPQHIRLIQGEIKELRRFYTLRDEVLKGAE